MMPNSEEPAKIYGPKKASKRPSPRATFARWWKRHMNIHGLRNSNYNEDLARRAFNAGRRAVIKTK